MLKIIVYASNLSHLLPIFCGRKNKALLWWYAITGFLFDITSFISRCFDVAIPGQANLFLVLEFIFIAGYYRKEAFRGNKWYPFYIFGIILVFIYHTLWIRPYSSAIVADRYRMNLEGGALLYLHYIIFAIIGLYLIIKKPENDLIGKSYFFWSNIAFLIYSSGVFFIFLSEEIILTYDKSTMVLLWGYIFCSFNIVKNVLLAKSLTLDHGRIAT